MWVDWRARGDVLREKQSETMFLEVSEMFVLQKICGRTRRIRARWRKARSR